MTIQRLISNDLVHTPGMVLYAQSEANNGRAMHALSILNAYNHLTLGAALNLIEGKYTIEEDCVLVNEKYQPTMKEPKEEGETWECPFDEDLMEIKARERGRASNDH